MSVRPAPIAAFASEIGYDKAADLSEERPGDLLDARKMTDR